MKNGTDCHWQDFVVLKAQRQNKIDSFLFQGESKGYGFVEFSVIVKVQSLGFRAKQCYVMTILIIVINKRIVLTYKGYLTTLVRSTVSCHPKSLTCMHV